MGRRAAAALLLTAFGLMLAGCGPCGFTWSEWHGPAACRAEPKAQH
jgi:hypothetical protein